jgi:hypothetical protein
MYGFENCWRDTETLAKWCLCQCERKQHSTCFYQEYSKFVGKGKQATSQFLQDLSFNIADIWNV